VGGCDTSPVFDHVMIRVADLAASQRFYDTVLAPLGLSRLGSSESEFVEWGDFSVAPASSARPPTRGLHVAFAASSRALVDAFWRAGTQAGYTDDGAPGLRPKYAPDYYGAFLRDPDGNSAEAVNHGRTKPAGTVDHLWIRVADVARSRRFYEEIAPFAGYRAGTVLPDRAQFEDERGSFSVVAGPRTEHVHLAFPAGDRATVDAFHRSATEAGYVDDGAPGARPAYSFGYYAAYVLDPDGNGVEVVFHDPSAAPGARGA
jgi:catechol 2,3-dioxygenase-like lactoylglutathione lyase family enzyme